MTAKIQEMKFRTFLLVFKLALLLSFASLIGKKIVFTPSTFVAKISKCMTLIKRGLLMEEKDYK